MNMPADQIAPNAAQDRMKKTTALLLAAVLLLSTGLRLGTIRRPFVGNFANKSVVYAMNARNWVLGRASLWYPTIDIMRDGRRSLHMIEFPLSAYATGALWHCFGGSLDVWGRLASILCMAAASCVLFVFIRARHGPAAALAGTAVFAFAPLGILYGCGFLLQPSTVLFCVLSFCVLDRWMSSGRAAWWTATAVFTAAMILTKVYAGVLLLPLGWTALFEHGSGVPRRRRILGVLALGLALVPPVFWYAHAYRTAMPENPRSARVFYSVRHGGEDHFPPHPLLKAPDYYRQILDNSAGIVLTPVGFTLALFAVFHPGFRRYVPWAAALAVLLVLLPRKFHEMDYYYMIFLPLGALLAGLGWQTIDEPLRRRPRVYLFGTAFICAVFVLFSLRYAVKPTYGIPRDDRSVVAAGAAVQRLSRPEEPVVTRHGSCWSLLYYCDRPGWLLSLDDNDLSATLRAHAAEGARLFVVTGPDTVTVATLLPDQAPIEQGPGYAVYEIISTPPQ